MLSTTTKHQKHVDLFLQNKAFHRSFAIKQKYSVQGDFFLEMFVVSLKTSKWNVLVSNEKSTYFGIMVEEFCFFYWLLPFHPQIPLRKSTIKYK